MAVRLNILVWHDRYFVSDEEFIDLNYSGSYDTMRDEKTVVHTIRMTEDSGEVDHEATPPVFERVDESFEGPIDVFYNAAAAEILDYFETTYPGIDFYLGARVRAPQLIQNQIDEIAGSVSVINSSINALQSSITGAVNGAYVAISDHASDPLAHGDQFAAKQDLITPGAPIANATNSTDVISRFNELLAQMRTQGLTQT